MTTDWIKIEPGCRMPKEGERVLVADGMAWCEAKLRGLGWYLESGCRVTPTHWLPIVPPAPEPDACAVTPQAQRIAIAELLGWKWYRQPATGPWADKPMRALYHPELHKDYVATLQPADMTERPCNAEFLWREGMVPDFPGDLNAMFSAEQMLTNDQCQLFAKLLVGLNNGDPQRVGWEYRYWAAAHATAAQHAEAFLKTLGKWTE